ncbi:MAG: glycosyl transferase [Microbacterium sp.]|nr:glycosyl transferase [Microbacterium sp.]
MRFVWAVVAFVVALGLIGAGIAQRTIFMGPSSQQLSVEVEKPAPFVLLDGAVLREHPGAQTLLIRGSGEIFASYGRTADMEAWLADTEYNHVTAGKNGALKVELVSATTDGATPATPAPTDTPAATDGTDAPPADGTDAPPADGSATDVASSHDPKGSDLWLTSFDDKDLLVADMQVPDGVSVLIAYDGVKDAPNDISVSWPLDNSTPAAGPLVVSGVLVLLVGLILYVLGIRHQRRGRGPRRKGPGPLPVTEPLDLAAVPAAERAAVTAGDDATADPSADGSETPKEAEASDETTSAEGKTEMRSQARARRRRMLALPALGLTALLAAGCSADSWPQLGASTPDPSPSPTIIAPENQKPPAVTEPQATRILQEISATLADADGAMDLEKAKTRLDGAALAARTTEYTLRAAIPETPAPAVIPTEDVQVILPEATDRWPRTVLMVSTSKSDKASPQTLLVMSQADPWSNYKVTDLAEVSSDKLELNVAAAWLGTSFVPADSAFLGIAPDKLGAAFSDLVDAADKSAFSSQFDDQSLALAQAIRDSRQGVVQKLADKGASETSHAEFDMTPYSAPPVALATLDSGAIVSVSVIDTQKVTPTNPDAVIQFDDNPQVKALTGVKESKTGIESTYLIQLFFAVPAQGSTEQIRLLGYHQDILGEQVIK